MSDLKPGTYAVFETSQGKITCQLFPEQAPATVENFISLAQGSKEFTDAASGARMKRPFYDGLVFHRVIPDFMIQGGCPLGSGMGGPGYKFKDEFVDGLGFDRSGRLAMANSGPNTNGSQFFITVAPTAWLNKHHTIFGQVVEGQDVADKISKLPKDRHDRPATPVVINSLKIVKVV
jgi:peptidyl-prolyl cis-trans isomerase A (cyclophilin A)